MIQTLDEKKLYRKQANIKEELLLGNSNLEEIPNTSPKIKRLGYWFFKKQKFIKIIHKECFQKEVKELKPENIKCTSTMQSPTP